MTATRESWLIFGSGPGVLVLAERLSSHGHPVTVLNPQRQWAGVFGGTTFDKEVFDNGMTAFEFDLFGEPRDDLAAYNPGAKHDVGKYIHFVRAYLGRFLSTHEIPSPQILWQGELFPDLLITNQFELLRGLSPSLKAAIMGELERIVGAPNPLHARLKHHDPVAMARRSFEELSLANHGPTLHRLFVEPLFRKVLDVSPADVPALFHRSGWAPLFYPETLLSQFGAHPQHLKRTVFNYPDDLYFGAFLRRLIETVRARPGVTLVEGVTTLELDPGGRAATTAQGRFEFDRLVWGGDLRRFPALASLLPDADRPASATDDSPRASLELYFLRVRREGLARAFTVLIDPDPAVPFYRVTNQSLLGARDPEVHQVILECNSARRTGGEAADPALLDAAFARYGIDRHAVLGVHHRTFADALQIPSYAQMVRFNALREAAGKALPDVQWLGPSSAYTAVTMNEQLLQALRIARKSGVPN